MRLAAIAGAILSLVACASAHPEVNNHATATFEIGGWEEKRVDEADPKLTHVRAIKTFRGDVTGTSTLEYTMFYRPDGTASFVGFERIVGSLQGHAGSFVLRHEGTFEKGTANVTVSVVPGSGTGELTRVRGGGGFAAGHAPPYPFALDFALE
jgi:Protein of unknown function (DUF3224)